MNKEIYRKERISSGSGDLDDRDKAAEFLWELNGRILSKEHYKKYVYDGLKEWFDFPSSDVAQWENNYKELNGIDPFANDQNSFSCD